MLDFAIFAVTFVLALLVIAIYLYPMHIRQLFVTQGSKRSTTVPGLDPSHPKKGNLGDIDKAGSLHEFLLDLHDTYGDIASFWMGERLYFSIASPELFKEHEKAFDRPPEFFIPFEPLVGPDSILYANGPDGRERRHMYDASFGHKMVASFLPIFQTSAEMMTSKWLAMSTKEEHIPLCTHMMALTIKIITLTSFGDYFKDEKEILKFKKNYDFCFSEMERLLVGDIPVTGSERLNNFEKAKGEMIETIKEVVEIRKKNSPKNEQDKVFIDVLIEGNLPEEQLLSDAITYFIGGFHTSGNLVTWAIYFLASHQDVQDKLYQEIHEKLGDSGKISAENISDLVYLRQVLDESLRCSVLAPFAARVRDFDSQLGGYVVPKNTPVIHALGVVLQDEKLWPMPKQFDPERFSPENRKKIPVYGFEPFSGKRKCPGYRFFYVETSVVLAVLLQKFKINLAKDQIATAHYGIITKPKEEIWIMVESRKYTG